MLPLSIHSETMTSSGPSIYAPIRGRVLGSESLFHMITSWQNLCRESQPLERTSLAERRTSFIFSSCVAFSKSFLIATVVSLYLPLHTTPNPPL